MAAADAVEAYEWSNNLQGQRTGVTSDGSSLALPQRMMLAGTKLTSRCLSPAR
jgi:hypothetical protein